MLYRTQGKRKTQGVFNAEIAEIAGLRVTPAVRAGLGLSETAITSTLNQAVLVSTGLLCPCRAKRGDPWPVSAIPAIPALETLLQSHISSDRTTLKAGVETRLYME